VTASAGTEAERATNPTVRRDRGYGVISALALAVEAAEALAFLSDCDLA
jgi:hypothetical protein